MARAIGAACGGAKGRPESACAKETSDTSTRNRIPVICRAAEGSGDETSAMTSTSTEHEAWTQSARGLLERDRARVRRKGIAPSWPRKTSLDLAELRGEALDIERDGGTTRLVGHRTGGRAARPTGRVPLRSATLFMPAKWATLRTKASQSTKSERRSSLLGVDMSKYSVPSLASYMSC